MTVIKAKFHSLSLGNTIPSVDIADGTSSTVCGKGIVHASTSLYLDDILYVPIFPISLLFISKLTT